MMLGLKLTAIVHFVPAASEPPHGVVPAPTAWKLPLANMLEMLTAAALVLVTVSVLLLLVVPTSWVKLMLDGEKLSGEVAAPEPVPESWTSCGPRPAL